MITKLAVSGYRSLREVVLGLDRLNVVTGANGAGKSSLYRALRLLADVAQARVIPALAAERPSLEELRERLAGRSRVTPTIVPAELIRAERDRA